MRKPILQGKKLNLYMHIAAWAILFLLPVYLFTSDIRQDNNFEIRIWITTAIYTIVFYINYFWFIPRLLFRQRNLTYFFTLATAILGLYLVKELIMWIGFKPGFFPLNDVNFKAHWKFDFYNYLFTTVLISGFSVALRMSDKYQENEEKRKELEKEKLSSELAFLKNQVSPHFFFNTLNNIYSLTEINKKEAQTAILQLSKLMRYLLYESEKGDTQLSSEIAFMQNYIELMKLRLAEQVNLTVRFPSTYRDISVPPLIFIPFVENAFKHGVSYKGNSFIEFDLEITDNQIVFSSKNSLNPKQENLSDSGIGLENVKKRLNLLFQDKHHLEINQHDHFEVRLSIDI